MVVGSQAAGEKGPHVGKNLPALSKNMLKWIFYQLKRKEVAMPNNEINVKREQLQGIIRDLNAVRSWLKAHDIEYKDSDLKFGKAFDLLKLEDAFFGNGPLSQPGLTASTRAMREFSREWRRVVESLMKSRTSPEYVGARHALEALGVIYKIGRWNNSKTFTRVEK